MYFEPKDFPTCFSLALLACVAWGSWSNALKASSSAGVSFRDFYVAYCIGTFAFSMIAFVAFGKSQSFYCEDQSSWSSSRARSSASAAVGAGAVFNVANVLLTLGVKYGGLSLAFPVGIGTALVLGTISTYALDPAGNNPAYLFSGVSLAAVAVCVSAYAAHTKESSNRKVEATEEVLLAPNLAGNNIDTSTKVRTKFVRRFVLCAAAGVCMSFWSPLNALALADTDKGCDDDDENLGKLTAYSAFVFFCSGVVLVGLPICFVVLPRLPSEEKDEATTPPTRLVVRATYGLVGGAIWSLGTLSNSLAGMHLGLALSYAVGQAAPMVATTWGLLYYREYRGAPMKSFVCLLVMYLLFLGAIGLIAMSK